MSDSSSSTGPFEGAQAPAWNGETWSNTGVGIRRQSVRRPDHISVIVPVKDEAASIESLLHALLQQTYLPAEIVITDGGSQDHTRDLIRSVQSRSTVMIVLIEEEHALPGRGRNLAIAAAQFDWIACIDGGIVPQPDWLQELVHASVREPAAKIVYGSCLPVVDTYFAECAAITYAPPPGRPMRVIPSCLFHRSVWEMAGGFREDLRSGEDLLFFQKLDAAAVRGVFAEKALVFWMLQSSLRTTFNRFSTYSYHGMKAGLANEWQTAVCRLYVVLVAMLGASLFLPVLSVLPPVLLLYRAVRRICQWYRTGPRRRLFIAALSPARILSVAVITIVIDCAMFCGMLRWMWQGRDSGPSRSQAKSLPG
jgi:hypothetical protein